MQSMQHSQPSAQHSHPSSATKQQHIAAMQACRQPLLPPPPLRRGALFGCGWYAIP